MRSSRLLGKGTRVAPRAISVFFLLGVGGMIVWLLVVARDWRIESVSCVTVDGGGCPQEVQSALSTIKGMSLFSLSIRRTLNSIKERFGYISGISVKNRNLGSLVVELSVDKPALAVTFGEADKAKWYLLNKKGVIVGESENPGTLPRLHLNEEEWKFTNHRLSTPYADQAVPVLVLLGEKFPGIEARITQLGDLEMSIFDFKVLVSLEKDPSTSAATLQLLLAEPTIQDNRPKVIDLRFQNITLSY